MEPLSVAALVVAVLAATPSASSLTGATAGPAVQYFRFDPGTPTETASQFDIPVFVLGEPAGAPANASVVRQAWEDLTIVYLNDTPCRFANWSVSSWGTGRFTLRLVLSSAEVMSIEAGQALLALNASVVEGASVYGVAGQIDGTVLSSSVVVGAWWSSEFDIPNPPPSANPRSLGDVIADLAWFGASAAGRALYAAVTLGAVLLYFYEGQRLARERLARTETRGGPDARD